MNFQDVIQIMLNDKHAKFKILNYDTIKEEYTYHIGDSDILLTWNGKICYNDDKKTTVTLSSALLDYCVFEKIATTDKDILLALEYLMNDENDSRWRLNSCFDFNDIVREYNEAIEE